MSPITHDARQVLERILFSYGITTQKELSELLGLPSSNISNWMQRGSIPGNVIINCALATGTDLQWLVTGEFADSNQNSSEEQAGLSKSNVSGKKLYDLILASGGKEAINRILRAHGFSMQKELGERYGLSPGTISTWIRRDFFPAEVVIATALDTQASLRWLATGTGKMRTGTVANTSTDSECDDIPQIKRMSLIDGTLIDAGICKMDPFFLEGEIIEAVHLVKGSMSWLVDFGNQNGGNGRWLLNIDGELDIYDVARIPGNKLSVNGLTINFECNINDVEFRGKVLSTTIRN
jgi:lambda repressor-like predicted transcriptional regulator